MTKKTYTSPKAEISEFMASESIMTASSGNGNITSASNKVFSGTEYDLDWTKRIK